MEKALRYELNTITKLNGQIFPVHAPEGKKPPFLVYIKSQFNQTKTFEGLKDTAETSYLLNILCTRYEELLLLTKEVRNILQSFPLRTIGTGEIYIQDLTIRNISEAYEHELMLYRSIIDVQIFYKEV